MDTLNFFDEKTIQEMKNSVKAAAKDEHLTREQVNDRLFVEVLAKLSIEDRYRMLEACMFNDTFRRIRYRKTKA